MRYLTKEWYELCQKTGLHFDMTIHKGAVRYDEALYLKLYKSKEEEFVEMEREVYNVDPRFMLEQDESVYIPLEKFVNEEEISEADKVIYQMPTEEKDRIQKIIDKYDVRPPFDTKKCREEFRTLQETTNKEVTNMLPPELLQQIADIRVFTLGYCTKKILKQLKKISNENENEMEAVLSKYSKAQQAEPISQTIKDGFGFHDCEVTELTVGENVVMRFDTEGGFTDFNMLTFTAAKIIKHEDPIPGSTWIYQELYSTANGYEAHMLFSASEGLKEFIICCNDIIIENSEALAVSKD